MPINLPKIFQAQGFNRIEVLVLVSIVICVLLVAVFFILELQSITRDARRKADIETISQALEAHYNRQDKEHCAQGSDTYCHPKGSWFYGGQIPFDPLTGLYLNLPKDGDKKYLICAKLEKGGGNSSDANFYCRTSQQ